MSTYFMRQVAPMFEKPQAKLKAAEGGEEGAGQGGSAAGANSAAAGSSCSTTDPQPIVIDDDGGGGAGDATEDDDEATDSDGEKVPESSTDTDGAVDLPLSSQLQEQVSAFVAKENASASKKKRRVWSDDDRLM
eukprot:2690201-Rhodomonas_salina.1